MALLTSLRRAVQEVIGEDDRPLVVFSSVWPVMRELGQSDLAIVEQVLDELLEAARDRSVLMPAFAPGFVDGVCNLDTATSSTGILSERFRKRPGTRRTLSAFFPFAVSGPAIDEVIGLAPARAWGEGSLYEWMEQRDACFLMFGTHPTHSSYLHRLEWLARDLINYRFDKTFAGTLVRDGVSIPIEETLYVRRLDPPVINDFTVLMPQLNRAGMKTVAPHGVSIASYHAKAAVTEILPILRRDPFLMVKNRKDYEPVLVDNR